MTEIIKDDPVND